MSEFPVDSAENGDMAAVMENFQKKNAAMVSRPQVTSTSAAAQVGVAGSGGWGGDESQPGQSV